MFEPQPSRPEASTPLPTPPAAPSNPEPPSNQISESAGLRSMDLSAYGDTAFPAPELLRGEDPLLLGRASDVVRLGDASYVRSRSPLLRTSARTVTLKDHRETFVVMDQSGDVQPALGGEHGLYHDNTRFLSRFELTINGARPELLGAVLSTDNVESDARLVFEHQEPDGRAVKLLISRSTVLHEGTLHQRIRIANPAPTEVRIEACISVSNDFADMFEVRGIQREVRGARYPAVPAPSGMVLSYLGLDDSVRRTELVTSPPPSWVDGEHAIFDLPIAPRGSVELEACIELSIEASPKSGHLRYSDALESAMKERSKYAPHASITSFRSDLFNAWMSRSFVDLQTLVSETPEGPYLYAGLPWFNTKFGRDGLLSSLMVLPFQPSWCRGVLEYLAKNIATEEDDFNGAQPGRVLHEVRGGEMARLGEVPFGRSYETADATALAVVVAAEYVRHTGDLDFAASLWPSIEAQMGWIDRYGGVDGLVHYLATNARGLKNQGWMDSHDSMFHADGTEARQPLVACEVPGYVFAAKHGAAYIAELLGHEARATVLRAQAEVVRARFDELFWSDSLQSYGRALDGGGRLCAVLGSNAGHSLFSGIATPERSEHLARTLFGDRMFSGWGIRTLAEGEARYDPVAYHNGSVWPHDNALIAYGLSMFGNTADAARLLRVFHQAAASRPLHRLPELFSGEARGASGGPIPYPTACSPQAWAAAAGICLVRSALGLQIDALREEIALVRPCIPEFLGELTIDGLKVGTESFGLRVRQRGDRVEAEFRGAPRSLRLIVTDEARPHYLHFPSFAGTTQ